MVFGSASTAGPLRPTNHWARKMPAPSRASATTPPRTRWPTCRRGVRRSRVGTTSTLAASGTLASAFSIARSSSSGTVCRTVRKLGTGSTSCRAMIAGAVGPRNGGSPASISYSTQASE